MKIQYQENDLVVFESELFRTTTSLIIGEEYLLLIDPNWLPGEIEFIHQYIESISGKREKYLLFTHSDYDHIIGYGKFKNYQTIASENFILNPDKKAVLEQINTFDDQYYIKRNYPIEYPGISMPIKGDHFNLKIKSDNYIFSQGVGHNKDGLITFNASKNILIVGDYLSNIEFPYVYESFKEYKNTLNKLQKIMETNIIGVLIPGHGDFTKEKKEMLERINDSRTYIHALEKTIEKGESFDLDALFKKYHFPKVMTEFHNKNLELLRKEVDSFKI
jgi:glyoxylase-like metal-dependent hydrolase (beta-lactamase superfamily II)